MPNPHNFELLVPGRPAVSFGIGRPVTVEDFDPGNRVWRTQDTPNPVDDAVMLGRDHREGPEWSWQLSTDEDDEVAAMAAVAELGGAWDGDDVRLEAGQVAELRYSVADRVRSVFGRPRSFDPVMTNGILSGYVPISASFKCADHLHYGPQESRLLSIVPATVGGVVSPVTSPVSTLLSGGQRAGQFEMLGDVPSRFVEITFYGPVSAPAIELDGWVAGLTGTIPAGRWIRISALPWLKATTWDNGGGAGGRLRARTRLSEMRVRPGFREAVFTGTDATGTARAEVSWRPAYRTL